MKTGEKQSFPGWLFAIFAAGGFMASGIYTGIMSVEGITGMHLIQSVGFGILGLLMLWGTLSSLEPGNKKPMGIEGDKNNAQTN